MNYEKLKKLFFDFNIVFKSKNWDEIDRFSRLLTDDDISDFISFSKTELNKLEIINKHHGFEHIPMNHIDEIKNRISYLTDLRLQLN